MELYLSLPSFEDAASSLAELQRRGLRLAILQWQPGHARCGRASPGFAGFFERVMSVEEVGIFKPSRRVYRHAQQMLKLASPQDICFVSANSWDAKAAASFGFQVVLDQPERQACRLHSGGAGRRARDTCGRRFAHRPVIIRSRGAP